MTASLESAAADDIESLKAKVREFLDAHFYDVPPKTKTSGRVHLEVWRSKERRRPVGVEMGHKTLVNFWVIEEVDEPAALPASISRVQKRYVSDGRWTDDDGDGANSNLKAYPQLRGSNLVRLGVQSWDDAELILEHLAW